MTSQDDMRTAGRRGVLRAGAAALLLGAAGCGSGSRQPVAAPSSTTASPAPAARPSPSPSATPTASPSPSPSQTPLPNPPLWQPGPSEVQPDVKRRAVELVAALGAWPPGGQGAEAARARVVALGLPPALADAAGPRAPPAAGAGRGGVDAHYGGVRGDTARGGGGCRQWTRQPDGSAAGGGVTVDVRLSRAEPRWTVTDLHPGVPGPPAEPPPAALAKVLAQPRIELPPEALADLRSGSVHDSVMNAMLGLAGTYALSVSVVRTGHPLDVFGTTRANHPPQGRGVELMGLVGAPGVGPGAPAPRLS
ncbi:hypothetical protein ACFV4G_38320 [Kitasatospora sp. NPDC059747]|uniref:hypothetical protein n=1 Tax=Kitasatospora sp. NPDC059747 TaxID=3346930 RepID=UPI003647D745